MLGNNKLQNNKFRKLDNYCDACGKGFINHDKYMSHILNSHITCNEENCEYSAPKEIMYYHQLKHINNKDGHSITESVEETEKWLNCRRIKFPRSNLPIKNCVLKNHGLNDTCLCDKNKIQNNRISALEHYIRINMSKHESSKNIDKSNHRSKDDNKFSSNLLLCRKKKKTIKEKNKISKPLLFRLFENEIYIYEKKIISSISYIINSSLYRKHLT